MICQRPSGAVLGIADCMVDWSLELNSSLRLTLSLRQGKRAEVNHLSHLVNRHTLSADLLVGGWDSPRGGDAQTRHGHLRLVLARIVCCSPCRLLASSAVRSSFWQLRRRPIQNLSTAPGQSRRITSIPSHHCGIASTRQSLSIWEEPTTKNPSSAR